MFPVSQIFGCRLTISTFSVLFFAFSKADSPYRSLVLAQRGVLITLVEDVAILELRVERLVLTHCVVLDLRDEHLD